MPSLALWVAMTAAMMLPGALPTLLVFRATGGRTLPFALGYLVAWTAVGACVWATGLAGWEAGHASAGLVLAAAGLYQVTPLKRGCLNRCRAPLAFLRRHGRPGSLGALRTGTVHGLFCIGCCAGLMLVLLAVGMMNLAWMAAVAAVIIAEKVVPHGDRLAFASAAVLVVAGGWVAL